MFNKKENIKDEIILMTLSELVPTNHFLRKVAKAVNVNIKMYKSDKIKMYNYSKLT